MVSEAIIKEELAGMPNKEFYKKLMRSNRRGKCRHPRTCMGQCQGMGSCYVCKEFKGDTSYKKFSSRFGLFEGLFPDVEWTGDVESVYEK